MNRKIFSLFISLFVVFVLGLLFSSNIFASGDGPDLDTDIDQVMLTSNFDIEVDKVWVGGTGPAVTVHLLQDGVVVDTKILHAGNGWDYKWDCFPEKHWVDPPGPNNAHWEYYTYTITEDPVCGYLTDISGPQVEPDGDLNFIVTNTKISDEKIDVKVETVWLGPGLESVKVYLLADGCEIDGTKLDIEDWDYVWSVYKYDQCTGEEIVYTIEEEPLEGYDTNITGDQVAGFVVTNYNNETIDIPVLVNLTCDKATSINVVLSAKGVTLFVSLVDASTGWKTVFEDLPKYDPVTGEEIAYIVSFEGAEGGLCDFDITGDGETGYTINIRPRAEETTAVIQEATATLPQTGNAMIIGGFATMFTGAGAMLLTRKRK